MSGRAAPGPQRCPRVAPAAPRRQAPGVQAEADCRGDRAVGVNELGVSSVVAGTASG